ncbi:MAG: fumarate hydratase, partial [Endomicrobiia bacterium]
MRIISTKKIIKEVKKLCIEANCFIRDDLYKTLTTAFKKERSKLGKEALKILLENAKIARWKMLPLCQDTGIDCIFVEIGRDIKIVGGSLYDAINKGISHGYKEGYLRKSVVKDPLRRIKTNDNNPAIIYTDIVPGNKLKIFLIPKGAGAENMSRIKMFRPTASFED